MSKFKVGDSVMLIPTDKITIKILYSNIIGIVTNISDIYINIKWENIGIFSYNIKLINDYGYELVNLIDYREEHFDELFNN